MSRKLEELMGVMDYDELMRLKKDLDGGAISLKRILREKIRKRLREHEKSCATCSNSLNFRKTSNYTLIFGPEGFKKKASFCGLDCLGYFINKLGDMHKPKEDNIRNSDN